MSFMEAISKIEDDTAAWSYVLGRFRDRDIEHFEFKRAHSGHPNIDAFCRDGYWRDGRGETIEQCIRDLADTLRREFP